MSGQDVDKPRQVQHIRHKGLTTKDQKTNNHQTMKASAQGKTEKPLHIRRIIIKGLRAIKHLDLKITQKTTCIIGANNTGKSTLLHGLRLLLDYSLPLTSRTLQAEDFNSTLSIASGCQVLVAVEIANHSATIESEALFAKWAADNNHAVLCYRFRPTLHAQDRRKTGDINEFTLDNYDWEIEGQGSKHPAELDWNEEGGTRFDIERLKRFSVTFLKAVRNVDDDLRQSRNSPLARLVEAERLTATQKDRLISHLHTANTAISNTDELKTIGTTINDSFQNTIGDAYALTAEIGVAEASFESLCRSMTVLISGQGMNATEPTRNGLGLNNILYASMLLAAFKRQSTHPSIAGRLLLIEEPEAHLHPELQRVLFAVLADSQFQCITTTHSSHVASMAKLENMAILSGTPPAISAVVPSDRLSQQEQLDVERYLDATKSALLFSHRVILVEGASEVFLIPRLVKQLLKIDLSRRGVAVIPIHGTHFGSFAKLFGPDGIQKRCAIITDGDSRPQVDPDDSEITTEVPTNPILSIHSTIENEHVRIFSCKHTFELELATPPNYPMFAETAKTLGATRNERVIRQATSNPKTDPESIAKRILRLAETNGKGRFAQVASQHSALAGELPGYIKDAIHWVLS